MDLTEILLGFRIPNGTKTANWAVRKLCLRFRSLGLLA